MGRSMGILESLEIEGHEKPEIGDLVDKRFAKFGRRPMPEADLWALGMATMVMPDRNPGAEAYLMKIAGTVNFAPRLTLWGRVVAIGIAGSAHKGRNGVRRREYVEGYDESWGRYAVADGLSIAICGNAPGLVERCDALKCGKQGYQRIRDFVGGATICAITEFRCALEWALGYRRDRVFEGRWEGVTGLKWDAPRPDATMAWGSGKYPLFAMGCGRIHLKDSDTRQDPKWDKLPKVDPETLYQGLRPTDWWDDGYARLMRLTCPARTIYPATD